MVVLSDLLLICLCSYFSTIIYSQDNSHNFSARSKGCLFSVCGILLQFLLLVNFLASSASQPILEALLSESSVETFKLYVVCGRIWFDFNLFSDFDGFFDAQTWYQISKPFIMLEIIQLWLLVKTQKTCFSLAVQLKILLDFRAAGFWE